MSGRCLASEKSLYLEKTVRVRPGYRGYAPPSLRALLHSGSPRVRFLVSSTTTSPHGPTRFKARLYASHRTAVPSRGRDEHVARSHDFIHLHSALLSLLSRVYSLKSSPRLEDARQIGLSARRDDRLHVLKLIAGSCLSCSRRAHGVRVIGVLALGGTSCSACDTRCSAFFEDVLAFWKTSGRAQEHDLAYRRRPLLNGRFEVAAGFRRLPYCIFFTFMLRFTMFCTLETRIAALLTTDRSISRSARASRISSRKP